MAPENVLAQKNAWFHNNTCVTHTWTAKHEQHSQHQLISEENLWQSNPSVSGRESQLSVFTWYLYYIYLLYYIIILLE